MKIFKGVGETFEAALLEEMTQASFDTGGFLQGGAGGAVL
jgi:hypothetical protein